MPKMRINRALAKLGYGSRSPCSEPVYKYSRSRLSLRYNNSRGYMRGIKYIVDEKGEKTAIVIDLKKYGELWDELAGLLLYLERKDEPRMTLEEVQERLRQLGKLGA